MRKAAFAGQFYPASETGLRAALDEAFTGERGPGSTPPKTIDRNVVAAIAPHAGIQYSGPCAAWAYHALAASPKPDFYLLLGPNHLGRTSGTTTETWETPLGAVRADQEFIRALTRKGNIRLDDEIFTQEHSLEVHVPFLQYAIDEHVKIVPLMISEDADLQALALDIKEALVETGKTAVVIASSDFTHHGPQYRYVRFTEDPQAQIAVFDKQFIDLIKNLDVEGFQTLVEKELATICGALPIALLLRLVKDVRVNLEQYYTSAELSGDEQNSVSYAAITFEKA